MMASASPTLPASSCSLAREQHGAANHQVHQLLLQTDHKCLGVQARRIVRQHGGRQLLFARH